MWFYMGILLVSYRIFLGGAAEPLVGVSFVFFALVGFPCTL